jgi:hypothetical protein
MVGVDVLPIMQTVRALLANRPILSGVLALAIAVLIAACSPGGGSVPGY